MTAAYTPEEKAARVEARRAARMAENAPQRRAAHVAPVANVTGQREIHTGDYEVGQLPPVNMAFGANLDEERDTVIVPADSENLHKSHLEALKFAEEGVWIIISKSQEKNPAGTIYCAVNGEGAEIWDTQRNRWVKMGWLPVAQRMLVKRKFVEVLLRARKIDIQTDVGNTNEELPRNEVIRNSHQANAISIVGDSNPDHVKVSDWVQRLLNEAL